VIHFIVILGGNGRERYDFEGITTKDLLEAPVTLILCLFWRAISSFSVCGRLQPRYAQLKGKQRCCYLSSRFE
jgi:hypothetical protein